MSIKVVGEAVIEIFPQRIQRLTDTPDGPVGLAIRAKADELLNAARPKIGTRYSGTTGKPEGPRSRMANSGSVVHLGGASFGVVFSHPAAYIHHEGASSHGYDEEKWYSNPNPGSTRHGGSRKFRKHGPFSHPGHAGNPFLVEAAVEVGLRPSGELRRGTRQVPIFRG